MDSLLYYNLDPQVTAFSTTRIPTHPISETEREAMGNYAAFNLTHYCGDEPERVAENRQWLARELHIPASQLWLPRQTHTDNIGCIDADFALSDSETQTALLDQKDALITDLPLHCIGVSTADCIPILVYDKSHKAVAAIHAGWRGTVQKIALKTLQKMQARYGTNPSECLALIGPGISPEAFEVGDEVVMAFEKAGFTDDIIHRPNRLNHYAKAHIDLWAANVQTLEEAGLALECIQVSGICTYTHSDTFFSARKLGIQSGRIYTGIMLKP